MDSATNSICHKQRGIASHKIIPAMAGYCVGFIIVLSLFNIRYFVLIGLGICIPMLIFLHIRNSRRISYTDMLTSLVILGGIIITFFTTPPVLWFKHASEMLLWVEIYMICRVNGTDDKFIIPLFRVVTLASAIILAIGITAFAIHYMQILQAGFNEAYNFRHLFRPLGMLNNSWAQLLILFLPWVEINRKRRMALTSLIFIAIILTFSRGAYIATAVFILGGIVFARKKAAYKSILPALILSILICAIFFHTSFSMMFNNASETQSGSDQWRINGILDMADRIKDIPLLGYGSGRYSYFNDISNSLDSSTGFTSLAPNTLIRLISEYGIFGTILIATLLLTIIFNAFKHNHAIIGIGLCALFAKDMTISTSHTLPALFFTIAIYAACVQQPLGTPYYRRISAKKAIARLILLVTPLSVIIITAANAHKVQHKILSGNCNHAEYASVIMQTGISVATYYRDNPTEENLLQASVFLKNNESVGINDPYFSFLKTYLDYSGSKPDKGNIAINRNLYNRYRNNDIYSFLEGLSQLDAGNEEEAAAALARAIALNPALLNTKEYEHIKLNNPAAALSVKEKLCSQAPATINRAVAKAKYGYILHYYNDDRADEFLKEAVACMPSLVTPWVLLGDESKYTFLRYGMSCHNAYLRSVDMTKKDFLDLFIEEYSPKFRLWYGYPLLKPMQW